MQKSIIRITIGTGLMLLIPLFLWLLAIWHWRPGALVCAFVLLLGAAGFTYQLVAAKKLSNKAYRFAVGVALAAVLLLVWMNAAVGGILGDDPANMMYFGFIRLKRTRFRGVDRAERITSKIGLNGTYLTTGNIDVKKNEALTYIHFGGDWKPVAETHPTILFSAGAIVSTPGDMAKFIQALFEGKLVSKDTLDHMKTMRDGEGFGMMEPFTFAGKTFYGHTGGADNYGAWLAYEPEEKLAVAYTTNAKIYPVGNIVRGVVDIYYHRPFQIPALESIAVTPEVLDRYVGVYSIPDAPAKATVTRGGSTLFFQPPGESSAVPLEATAEDKFQIEGVAVFTFDAAKNQMTIKRRGGERVFTKEK